MSRIHAIPVWVCQYVKFAHQKTTRRLRENRQHARHDTSLALALVRVAKENSGFRILAFYYSSSAVVIKEKPVNEISFAKEQESAEAEAVPIAEAHSAETETKPLAREIQQPSRKSGIQSPPSLSSPSNRSIFPSSRRRIPTPGRRHHQNPSAPSRAEPSRAERSGGGCFLSPPTTAGVRRR
jgi:hypothetical protein